MGIFLPERIRCLIVTKENEVSNNSSVMCHGPMGREKAVLLLPMDLHKDKCNKLQVISLFVIQILETNLISLEPWDRGNALSKLSCKKQGGD